MKNQALFSSKDKSKKLKCRLLQFLFGALRLTIQAKGARQLTAVLAQPKIVQTVFNFINTLRNIFPSKTILHSTGLAYSTGKQIGITPVQGWQKGGEILIFPRTAGNTGISREILVIPGNYWEIGYLLTKKMLYIYQQPKIIFARQK